MLTIKRIQKITRENDLSKIAKLNLNDKHLINVSMLKDLPNLTELNLSYNCLHKKKSFINDIY